MSALPYSSAFKWSRSVKDIYMRGKANLKKFFSESFCKLGKKQTSRSNQYSTSPPALILHFLPGRLPHGLPHGHSEVLVKIISTSTSPSPFLSYLNMSRQQPWTQLTPLLLTWFLHPLLLPSTSTAPSLPLPPGSCHLCKL